MSLTQTEPKHEVRARLRRLRAGIPFAERDRCARALVEAFAAHVKLAPSDVVGAYANQGAEMSLWPLLQALHGQGVKLALPVTVAPDQPLLFRAWKPGDALVRGAHGTAEPAPALKIVKPSLLLVPLVAFDGEFYRLGQGGGYYDRTLALLRKSGGARAIGIAYAVQQVPALPYEKHDQKLDAVLTEAGLLAPPGGLPDAPPPLRPVKARQAAAPKPARPAKSVKKPAKAKAKPKSKAKKLARAR